MSKQTLPPEPWERQRGETLKAFEAFRTYRDMEGRSLSKAGRLLGKSKAVLERWSSANEWQKRVAAWDAEQDRIARQAQIDEIKKMRKRHSDLASAMLVKAARALQRIPEDEIKAGDVSRMVETAAKLERISRGDVGEVVEERDGGPSTPIVQFYMPTNSREDEGVEETKDDN